MVCVYSCNVVCGDVLCVHVRTTKIVLVSSSYLTDALTPLFSGSPTKVILGVYEDGDAVWIHDYHLMVLPKMLYNIQCSEICTLRNKTFHTEI